MKVTTAPTTHQSKNFPEDCSNFLRILLSAIQKLHSWSHPTHNQPFQKSHWNSHHKTQQHSLCIVNLSQTIHSQLNEMHFMHVLYRWIGPFWTTPGTLDIEHTNGFPKTSFIQRFQWSDICESVSSTMYWKDDLHPLFIGHISGKTFRILLIFDLES